MFCRLCEYHLRIDYIGDIRFVYTCNLDLAISLSDAISIEILPSSQIATAGNSDNMWCFLTCVNTALRLIYTRDLDLAISLSDLISIEILPSFQITTADDSDNVCFLACVNTT